VPLPPGGSTFPPGGGTPSHLPVPLLGRQPPPLLCSSTPHTEGVLAHSRRGLVATGARRRRRRLAAQGAGAAAMGAGAESARCHIGSPPPRRASAPPRAATSLPSGPRASSPTRRSSRLRRPFPSLPPATSAARSTGPTRGPEPPPSRGRDPPSLATTRHVLAGVEEAGASLHGASSTSPLLRWRGPCTGCPVAPFPSRPSPLSSGRSHLGLAVPPNSPPALWPTPLAARLSRQLTSPLPLPRRRRGCPTPATYRCGHAGARAAAAAGRRGAAAATTSRALPSPTVVVLSSVRHLSHAQAFSSRVLCSHRNASIARPSATLSFSRRRCRQHPLPGPTQAPARLDTPRRPPLHRLRWIRR
jgi:hypothetical protein